MTSPERDAAGQFRRQGLPPSKDPHPEPELGEYFLPQQAGDPRVRVVALTFALALALGLGLAALGLQRSQAAVRRWREGLRGDWLNSAIAAFSLASPSCCSASSPWTCTGEASPSR